MKLKPKLPYATVRQGRPPQGCLHGLIFPWHVLAKYPEEVSRHTHDGTGVFIGHHTCGRDVHKDYQQLMGRDDAAGQPFLLDEAKYLFLIFTQNGVIKMR